MTDLFEAGKVPGIGKITALLRLHGLHRAIVGIEEIAFDPTSAVLEPFPGAQRALFRRYHTRGCSRCGFFAIKPLAGCQSEE